MCKNHCSCILNACTLYINVYVYILQLFLYAVTEASHPSVQASNHILLLSTCSSGSGIMSTLSSDEMIQLWDTGRALFIQVYQGIC